MRRPGYWFDATAIVCAVALKVATPPASWIEAHYSNGAYPWIDRVVRTLTAPFPLCAGDVLFVVAVVTLVRYWIVARRRTTILRRLLRTAAGVCFVFVWFVGSWAYNYARVPLREKIVIHNDRTGEQSVARLGDRVVDELSHYAKFAHREHLSDDAAAGRLQPAFEATIRRLGDEHAFAAPRVKPTLFDVTLRLTGTTGFTDPWTHEINLDASALAVERPSIYAHEWAHLAGFADEAEANFISVIACTTSRDPLLAYSGWLLVWFNLPPTLSVKHRLSRAAYDDIIAIRARFARNVNPQAERASRVVYDRYLKSNHVKAGFASYALFIRWMTGADFDGAGLPLVRTASQT